VRRRALQQNDDLCTRRCGSIETANHLFIGCDIFGFVWYLIYQWLDISLVFSGSIYEHFVQFTNLAGMSRSTHSTFMVIWLACTWEIWKDRNDHIFKNAITNPFNIVEKVKLIFFVWLSSSKVPLSFCFHDWWRHPLQCIGVM